MIEKFVAPNDPILLKVAGKIPISQITSDEIQKDIGTMLGVAYPNQQDRS